MAVTRRAMLAGRPVERAAGALAARSFMVAGVGMRRRARSETSEGLCPASVGPQDFTPIDQAGDAGARGPGRSPSDPWVR